MSRKYRVLVPNPELPRQYLTGNLSEKFLKLSWRRKASRFAQYPVLATRHWLVSRAGWRKVKTPAGLVGGGFAAIHEIGAAV